MKRSAVVVLLCIVLSITAVNPVQSYTNPTYSDADAVATALAAYNTADAAYNTALNVYNSANAAYNSAKTAFDSAKANYDVAVIEYNAAASALNAAIASANAASDYMNNQCRQLGCSDSQYANAVADWLAKTNVYYAAVSRRDASVTNVNACAGVYNAAIPAYNATVVPNNNAANNLVIATAAKTSAYNLYVEAKATADRNNTTKFIPPKITVPQTVTTTTINGPVIVISKKGAQIPAKKYKSCNDLRKIFPKGVAKNTKSIRQTGAIANAKDYLMNIGFDRDKDGVACELA